MPDNPASGDKGIVISLFERGDLAGDGAVVSKGIDPFLLDRIMGQPRFTSPANDESALPVAGEIAPANAECRKAKLLSMWIEILAEDRLLSG